MLVAFSYDVYLHSPPVNVAAMISANLALYKKVRLRIDWGPAKSELALPPNVDLETLPLPRGDDGCILPHLVHDLEACLGVPRHRLMYANFIAKAMQQSAARHYRLLLLAKDIAEEAPLTIKCAG